MGRLITYLTFNGNCRAAMEFYRECLGGKLHLQTLDESDRTDKLPPGMKQIVVQASLKNDNLLLMGTDMIDEELLQGNSVSILLDCDDMDQIRAFYAKLKTGGIATNPLRESLCGDLLGGLTDKFGNHWLLQCRKRIDKGKNK